MPTMVVSGVNLVEGGMLKILQDCLRTVRERLPEWRIVAIVNNEGVCDIPGVQKIIMPDPKKSWLRRIYTEYVTFRNLSKQLDADIWWSLHDMSPRVRAGSQFVYCHTPNPFYGLSPAEVYIEPKLAAFKAMYSLFYRLNISSNRAVIVQQHWLREEFKRRYGARDVIVAHPIEVEPGTEDYDKKMVSTFVYPALARALKNFELIGEAARLLEDEADWSGRILWTINPDESRFTRRLHRRYGRLKCVKFIGRQDRAAMTKLYEEMDCLLFPSRLETWGLPISETKSLGKPMIVADLPYAHETVGTYDRVRFVDPKDARQLANLMLEAHRTGWSSAPVRADPIPPPFANDWPRLVDMIVALHEGRTLAGSVVCGGAAARAARHD